MRRRQAKERKKKNRRAASDVLRELGGREIKRERG